MDKKDMKYQVGDLVELNSEWNNQLGLIIDIDDADKDNVVYLVDINGEPSPGWLSFYPIRRKIN